MGKVIKILLSFLGLLILLLIGTIIALPMLIDPNDFKPQIIQLVHKHTGRGLTIEGNLKLAVFPWLRLETGRIRLNNRVGFDETRAFVRIAQADFKVKLIPLLSKRLEIDTIWLKGLALNLEKNIHGMNNWDDFVQASELKQYQLAQTTQDTHAIASFNPAHSLIRHAVIENAKIIWNNRITQQRISLDPLKLQMDNIRLGSPIDFQMDVTLESQKPEVKEMATIVAKITVDEALNHIQLDDIRLNTHTEGEIIANTKIKALITLSCFNFDRGNNRIVLEHASINAHARITGNSIPGDHQTVKLSANTHFDSTQQTLSLSEFKLNAGELDITGDITGAQILDAPQLKGQLILSSLSPKKLIKQLGWNIPETQDAHVLTRMDGQLNFKANPDQVTLSDIVFHMDDSHLSGTALIKHFQQPAIRFDLALDQIDIDRYSEPTQRITNESLKYPLVSTLDNAQMLIFAPLRTLDLQGTFDIKALTISGISAHNIRLNAQ